MSKVGSPLFMAPEIIMEPGKYNLKADTYSWAVTFWEMLTLKTIGRENASCFKELHKSAARATRPDLSRFDLPESMKKLLQSAWHPSVTERASMKEVCTQLDSIVEELAVLTEPEDLEDNSESYNNSPILRKRVVEAKELSPSNNSKLGLFWKKKPDSSERTEETSGILSNASATSVF